MKFFKTLLKIIAGLIGTVVALAIFLIIFLTITEYKPKDEESLGVVNSKNEKVNLNTEYKLLSWNIGYASLSSETDFFMDGGTHIYATSKDIVNRNLNGIYDIVDSYDPDFVYFQEVDRKSTRSKNIDEVAFFEEKLGGYSSCFALNYKCAFVPFPMPPLMKVESGLYSLSKYYISSSERLSLPVPFKWPVRMANLKRGLLVERLPIEGSDKELVLINLHLEAYDDGTGKIEQTKMLLNLLKEEYAAGNYVIAAGDFNQTFSNVDMSKYPILNVNNWAPGFISVDDFADFNCLVDDSKPTCRSLNQPYTEETKATQQYYVIDGMIVTKNVTVEEYKTLDYDFAYSDHNPTYLKFKLA